MKLRLRSLETKETLRIELPIPCSLQQLKDIISSTLISSSSSHPPSASIHLSLNRRDELQSLSPDDSLQSLGIASGDLIYFTYCPAGFTSGTLTTQLNFHPESNSDMLQNPQKTLIPEPNFQKQLILESESINLGSHDVKGSQSNAREEETLDMVAQKEETLDIIPQEDKILDSSETESDDVGLVLERGNSFSVPCFLRKVFTAELRDDCGRDHKLLVIAIHAVMLESGFVGFDLVSGMEVNGFHFQGKWPSSVFRISLSYTLPEIISQCYGIDTVVLKFRSLGKFFNVYGSLDNGVGMHGVQLDEDQLVPFLNVVWANCGLGDEIDVNNGPCCKSSEGEVFMFWRTVKDKLALPLLIDLCEKAGLPSPPCFMRLPTDIKLKILESLPGVDIAKLGSVCSELRYLISNDDLWKQKFVEAFENEVGIQRGSHWKEKFAKSWEARKRRKTTANMFYAQRRRGQRPPYLFQGSPHPLWGSRVPPIIGGEYDLWPQIGMPLSGGQTGRSNPSFVPHCDMSGPSV